MARAFAELTRWLEQYGQRYPFLKSHTFMDHSWPCLQRHQTVLLDPAVTSQGVSVPFLLSCHISRDSLG